MRLLAVDDDSSVLQALMAALRSLPGHEVRAAANGERALQVAEEWGGLDLLVTDMVMDPVDGLSLRDDLLSRFPDLRTIFVSGYDLSGYVEQIGSTPLLPKPLDLELLRSTVESELAQVPPPPPAPAPRVAVPVPVAQPRAVAAVPQAPKAIPVARAAVPQPAATPMPKARAVPSTPNAQPRAVPGAQPRAVPSAQPRAVPTAQPSAVPTAQPRAVPSTQPRAVPAAQPRAVPPPQPSAVPAPAAKPAVPAARAVPTAVPKAVAPPAATPAAVPKAAAPSARPPVAAPKAVAPAARAVSASPPAVPFSPTPPGPQDGIAFSLLGQVIGGYKITSLLGQGRWGPVFLAVQTAINRPVGLKVLDPERAANPGQKDRFIADARAKANVQHPSILSVYEAGSAEPWFYYTHEYVDGQNLAEMAAAYRKIDQATALKIVRVAAEGLLYFERGTIPHTAFAAKDIFLGTDGQPRLGNLATQLSDQSTSAEEEMETLGRAILPLLPVGPEVSAGLRTLLGRTFRTHASPIPNWAALLQGAKALEPKVVPLEAAKISAQDRAAVEAVEKARRQQKRAFFINVGAMASLLLLALFVAYFVFFRSNERRLTAQVHIPAGDFISGVGTNSHNEEFWIDKYEVTIGQYAKFVQWIEANPGEEHSFDHPRQPRGLTHIPEYWEVYYGNAEAGKRAHSVPISLNSPIMSVTWWDAYAYAKWRGRELPTALEWERAARGRSGLAFPWGETPDAAKANTNSDYNPRDPGAKGNIDGANFWGDVDSFSSDKSPEGVMDMAGNVSEWTASWTPDNQFPILKGGNYTLPLQPLSESISNIKPDTAQEYIGFRTISRTAPGK